jgi:hypothetical protein
LNDLSDEVLGGVQLEASSREPQATVIEWERGGNAPAMGDRGVKAGPTMFSPLKPRGWTSWMNWLRKPLSAVNVVETVRRVSR